MKETMEEKIICSAICIDMNTVPDETKSRFDADRIYHQPRNIKENCIVLCGLRHAAIISNFFYLTGIRLSTIKSIQGFVTNDNRFLDRDESLDLMIETGQLLAIKGETIENYPKNKQKRLLIGGVLTSEDLY
jgi:hypothetical protein